MTTLAVRSRWSITPRMNTRCPAPRATSSCRLIRLLSTLIKGAIGRRSSARSEPQTTQRNTEVGKVVFMGTLKHLPGIRGTGRAEKPPNGGGGDHYRPGRHEPAGYYERLRRYRLAVGVLLVSVIMIFVAL